MRARVVLLLGSDDHNIIERFKLERRRLRARLWKRKNKDKQSAYHKAWRARNKERLLAARRAWREKNREQIRAYDRRRFQMNPALQEYRREKNREYRSRKAA
jgi:hypothetical protein